MLDDIRINDELSIITADPQGIVINYLATKEAEVMDVFNVSLFFSSAKSMLENLEQNQPWENSEQSLVVFGDSEEITLTFRMQGPPFEDFTVVLNENDSKNFINEMLKIADSKCG